MELKGGGTWMGKGRIALILTCLSKCIDQKDANFVDACFLAEARSHLYIGTVSTLETNATRVRRGDVQVCTGIP